MEVKIKRFTVSYHDRDNIKQAGHPNGDYGKCFLDALS